MSLTRNKIIFASLILIFTLITPGLVGCSSSIASAPAMYPEPSVKPLGLRPWAKWNPETNAWYDPTRFEWDPVTKKYKDIPHYSSKIQIGKNTTQTPMEWIEQHQNSTDEVDIAVISHYSALIKYIEIQRKENPNYIEGPGHEVGQAEGGPLEILTVFGTAGLQKLVDKVQWENPFVVNLEFAVDKICRTKSNQIGGMDYQVDGWKKVFNDRVSGAKSQVDDIALQLLNKTADEKVILHKVQYDLGIFALPEAYELIINQGNTSLIKYLPDILPLDKMKEYNVVAGQTDDATLKQALASCKDDIEIIKTLHAD